MSDFLNKFSKDNYEKMLNEEEIKAVEPKVEKKVAPVKKTPAKTKSTPPKKTVEAELTDTDSLEVFLDVDKIEQATIPEPKTTTTPSKKVSRNSVSVEEVTEIDPTYQKKQTQKFILIGLAIVLSLATIGTGFFLFNRVTIPNFIDKNVSEAKTWALKNRIELDITEEYRLEYADQMVAEQGKEPSSHLFKGSILSLTVSLGADPDEKIKLPDFATMTASSIESWKTENAAENVKIVKEFSETVDNGKFLRMEFRDTSMTSSDYRRKDVLTIYVSKGQETLEKNIEVPDFKNKTKEEVEEWAKTNEITLHIEESSSDTVPLGMIIEQSIAAKTKIAKKTEMTIKVSTGRVFYVPWFGNYTMTQAAQGGFDFPVNIVQEYHGSTAYGNLIWQSVSSGTWISESSGTSVDVYYSLGRPYIGDLEGMPESELPAYFYDFREKNANITYTVHYINGTHAERGKVSHASKRLEYVDMNTHVDVYVYK